MRMNFDYLLRSTLFLPGAGPFDGAALIRFCADHGFGHIMLNERRWCVSAGWYESNFEGGYAALKRFVGQCHDAGLLFTLHGRCTRLEKEDPLLVPPRPEGIVHKDGMFRIDPFSDLQKKIAWRWIDVADLVGADGIYLDGADTGAKLYDKATPQYQEAIVASQRAVIDQLSRPMLLQTSNTTDELHEHWCWSGQRDHYPNVYAGGWDNTREQWNKQAHIGKAKEALANGYPAQVGWLDFAHGRTTKDGRPIEDQNPASLSLVCDFAREHNLPIVMETTLEEVDSHPQRDELLKILKRTNRR